MFLFSNYKNLIGRGSDWYFVFLDDGRRPAVMDGSKHILQVWSVWSIVDDRHVGCHAWMGSSPTSTAPNKSEVMGMEEGKALEHGLQPLCLLPLRF